jgi:hypothetical protein
MARFSPLNIFYNECSRSKRSKKRRSVRKMRGGADSAADWGVKVWGVDQVGDPNQGNVIKANPMTGGSAPYTNTLPTSPDMVSTADMSKQALDMQGASVKYMVTPQVSANVQSDSTLPKTGGRRKTRRRGSKRKYGHKIRNGRRTKTIH